MTRTSGPDVAPRTHDGQAPLERDSGPEVVVGFELIRGEPGDLRRGRQSKQNQEGEEKQAGHV